METISHILAVILAITVLSNATQIQKCKEENAPEVSFMTVQLDVCDRGRCELKRGKTYDFVQKFKAQEDADKLKAVGTGKVYGYDIVVRSVADDDACKHISRRDKKGEEGKVCPLQKGVWYIYKKPIKISDNEIRIDVDVQWHLVQNNQTYTCFGIPVRIN